MTQIKLYGLGGQGVVTCAKILSKAVSIYENRYATTIPAYGHERRGAPVYTDMVIDTRPILQNCFVYKPDVVMVLDEAIIAKQVDVGKGIHPNTILVLNASAAAAERYKTAYAFREIYIVDATAIALASTGRGIPNIAMLGALAKAGIVKLDSIKIAIMVAFEKEGERNANAAQQAYNKTRTL